MQMNFVEHSSYRNNQITVSMTISSGNLRQEICN